MSSRYTTAAIEIHLSDLTEGMDPTGLDVAASNDKARDLVEEAVAAAYPQYNVSVFAMQTQGHAIEVVGWPNELDEEEIRQVAEDALGALDEGRWYVESDEGRTLRSVLRELDNDDRLEINDGAENWTCDNLIESLEESEQGRAELARRVNCIFDEAPADAEFPAPVGGISFVGEDGYLVDSGYGIVQVRA